MRRLSYLVVLIAGVNIIPQSFGAEKEFCPSVQMFQRKSRPSCWVALSVGHHESLCIGRKLFVRWLNARTPFSWCGRYQGRARVFSPAANLPRESKQVMRIFYANDVKSGASGGTGARVWRAIESLREKIHASLAPMDRFGIFRSLILNERNSSGALGFWFLLGFVHLISASGIHLYALHDWIHWILCKICKRSGLSVEVTRPLVLVVAGLAWAVTWLLAGMRAGFLRPFAVVCLRFCARYLGVRWRTFMPLACALGIDLVWGVLIRGDWGEALRWQGRIHYALSVGGGLLAMEAAERRTQSRWRQHAALAVGSWIFSALWELVRGHPVALATPLVSLVTIPFICLVVYPALFIALVFDMPWGLASVVEGATWALDGAAAGLLRFPEIWILGSGFVILAAVFGGIALLGLSLAWRMTLVSVALVLRVAAGFVVQAQDPASNASQVIQLDVGQGDAALVLRRNQGELDAGLIDTGAFHALSPQSWIMALSAAGVSRLNWIALSHLDDDHVGALLLLADLLPIGCVATSEEEWATEKGKLNARAIRTRGIRMQNWDQRCFPYWVLGPKDQLSAKSKGHNSMTGAFAIPLSAREIYLAAGDADVTTELRFADWLEIGPASEAFLQSRSRILKASHHGSRFSTSEKFLDLIRPTEVVFSAGLGNHYGHPSRIVLERVEAVGAVSWRTDRGGAWRFKN